MKLNLLRLKNYIFVDELEIEFQKGLTILTGETGSGKSILIGAINILLSEKISKPIVKKDTNYCEICVIFEDSEHKNATDFLEGFGSDFEDFLNEENSFCFVKRISLDGKNRCYINDKLVSSAFMKNVLAKFLEIHGQHSNQKIFLEAEQLDLLDRFANNFSDRKSFEAFFLAKQKIEVKLEMIKKAKLELASKKDFLKFELENLKKLKLKKDEDVNLEKEFEYLSNQELINSGLDRILEKTSLINSSLPSLVKEIQKLTKYFQNYENFATEITNCLDMFNEMETVFSDSKDRIDSNIYKFDEVSSRLESLNRIKKKYSMDVNSLIDYEKKLENDLQNLDYESDEEISLKSELTEILEKMKVLAEKIDSKRKNISHKIEGLVNENLQELAMEKAVFKIEIETLKTANGDYIFSKTGVNKVKFLVKTNPSQDFGELDKIASGGELSRIMLSLKSVLSDFDNVPVLIFDEIDTGISGKTAFIVGKKLKNIAKKHQVLCITHLAQVAVFGENNKVVKKTNLEKSTEIEVLELNESEKINEISRIIGGEIITETAIKNARELLEAAKK